MKLFSLNTCYYLLFFVLVLVIGNLFITVSAEEGNQGDYIELTVQSGDTIWGISEQYKNQHNLSFVDFVNWIETTNKIQAESIKPGETLIIPVKNSEENSAQQTYASKGF